MPTGTFLLLRMCIKEIKPNNPQGHHHWNRFTLPSGSTNALLSITSSLTPSFIVLYILIIISNLIVRAHILLWHFKLRFQSQIYSVWNDARCFKWSLFFSSSSSWWWILKHELKHATVNLLWQTATFPAFMESFMRGGTEPSVGC